MTGWSLKGLCDGYVRKDVQLAVEHMRFADTALLGMDSHMRRDVTTGEETQWERRGWTRRRLQETPLRDQVKKNP